MIHLQTLLLFIAILLGTVCLDSCHKTNNDAQPLGAATAKVYKNIQIVSPKADLGLIIADSMKQEAAFVYGTKNAKGGLSAISDIIYYMPDKGVVVDLKLSPDNLISEAYIRTDKKIQVLSLSNYNLVDGTVQVTLEDRSANQVLIPTKTIKLSEPLLQNIKSTQVLATNALRGGRLAASSCDGLVGAARLFLTIFGCTLSLAEIGIAIVATDGLALLLAGASLPSTLLSCYDAYGAAKNAINGECEESKNTGEQIAGPLLDCGSASTIRGVLEKEIPFGCLNSLLNTAAGLLPNAGTNNQNTSPSNSGGAYGDPHIRTLDGLYYDFQGYGEFIAVKSLTDNFEIQVRQEQIAPYFNRQVTLHSGIAVNTGNDKVCVYPNSLYVNGKQYSFNSTIIALTKGNVSYSNNIVSIVTDNEDVIKITIQPVTPAYLDYKVILNANRQGRVQGLLGNFDGTPANDTQIQGGDAVNPYVFTALYPAFTDSWRVSQDKDKSLFYYLNGATTSTYIKKDFPKSQVELDAAARLHAETVCRQQGLTEEPFFSACVLDVCLAGSDKYTLSAVAAEESKLLINNFTINKFTTFDEDDLNPHGNAEIADGVMYLTRASLYQFGAVYKKFKMNISTGFETSFDFSMTQPGGIRDGKNRVGADGLVFVIQDYGSKIIPPASGLGLGYDGLPRSLAIEFDTFDNKYYGITEGPNDIWINTQGINANTADDSKTLVKPQTLPLPSVMNDGKIHHVVIRYTKKSDDLYRLEMFYDNGPAPYLTADDINIQQMIGAYSTGVYMGFTASTGAGWENHIIHNWSFKPLP